MDPVSARRLIPFIVIFGVIASLMIRFPRPFINAFIALIAHTIMIKIVKTAYTDDYDVRATFGMIIALGLGLWARLHDVPDAFKVFVILEIVVWFAPNA